MLNEPQIITPTVGRVVWYYEFAGNKPRAATIADVFNDRLVNLTVHDYDGTTRACTSVSLVQPGDEIVPGSYFCEWMPYQKGQAAKTEQLEKQLDAADLKPRTLAPRLTQDDIQRVIVGAQFHRFPGTTLTVCCLHLVNGYTVTGESACVSEANFDAELGERLAREDAVRKVWALEGYLLRERLSRISEQVMQGETEVEAEHGQPFIEPPVLGARPAD